MDAISYIILVLIIVMLVSAVVYLDNRRNRWMDLAKGFAEESYHQHLRAERLRLHLAIAEDINTGLAEQLTLLVPATPSVSPDDAIANMKYCGTCHTYMHPNHFAIQPMHVIGSDPFH